LADPGINGKRSHRDDGKEVTRFKAPKARLMSLITDGVLTQKLPWSLVLLGVSIAIVLELCGVPSLPFAVGVYLPLSSSTPIFLGGIARYVADRWSRRTAAGPVSETESESSSGVLLSTGYIAGGAIGGVLIAFLSFPQADWILADFERWGASLSHALQIPTDNGPAVIAFGALFLLLVVVGIGWLLNPPAPPLRTHVGPEADEASLTT